MDIREIRFGEYSASINVSRGANCISLRHGGYGARILREASYDGGELDNPYLYGMPILFPVNRISGGCFSFEGREYVFPINEPSTNCHLHGELHRASFSVLEQSGERIVCSFRADKENPYLEFPHEFEVMIEYSLSSEGFHQKNTVHNLSDENMPCMLGFHTTFNSLFAGSGRTEVGAEIAEEYERNMKNYLPTGEKPDFDEVSEALLAGSFSPLGRPISRHYRAKSGGRLWIRNADKALRVVYENDEKLGFRLIYNGGADEYICLEPQTCLANAPNSPFDRSEAGFGYVPPHKEITYHSRIYIMEEKDV